MRIWLWLTVFGLVGAATPASAQVSTVPVLKRTLLAVAKEEDKGNQVLFMQIDHVHKGFSKSQTYILEAGSNYRVWAIGDDNRIVDIDLQVLDEDGDLVKKDDDEENIAIVTFGVRKTQKFTFKVIPDKMKDGVTDGFFSLVVVRY